VSRPKGYADWNPSPETLEVLAQVREACGGTVVEEELGETEEPSRLSGATAELAEAIHTASGPLTLLEDDPERGLVCVSRDEEGPFCATYKISVVPEVSP
jgi:hypothetical protein